MLQGYKEALQEVNKDMNYDKTKQLKYYKNVNEPWKE